MNTNSILMNLGDPNCTVQMVYHYDKTGRSWPRNYKVSQWNGYCIQFEELGTGKTCTIPRNYLLPLLSDDGSIMGLAVELSDCVLEITFGTYTLKAMEDEGVWYGI